MKKLFFGKGKIQNFGLELSKIIPNCTFDTQTGVLHISLKSGKVDIALYQYSNLEEMKKCFIDAIRESGLDTVDKLSVYNCLKASKVDLNYSKNKDVWDFDLFSMDIFNHRHMLDFFQNIKKCFECNRLNYQYTSDEKAEILIEIPYFQLPVSVFLKDINSEEKMKTRFVIDFVREFVKTNNLFGVNYESNNKVRKALENFQSLNLSYDEKYEILKCIEKIPVKTEDFIKIYKDFVDSNKEKDIFSAGINVLIGKYLYLSHQNVIMPDLKEFNHLPKEFFDTVEEIEKYSKGASIEER